MSAWHSVAEAPGYRANARRKGRALCRRGAAAGCQSCARRCHCWATDTHRVANAGRARAAREVLVELVGEVSHSAQERIGSAVLEAAQGGVADVRCQIHEDLRVAWS